jgi:hypothetical protein
MLKWILHDLRPPLPKFKSKKKTFLSAGACTRKKLEIKKIGTLKIITMGLKKI